MIAAWREEGDLESSINSKHKMNDNYSVLEYKKSLPVTMTDLIHSYKPLAIA